MKIFFLFSVLRDHKLAFRDMKWICILFVVFMAVIPMDKVSAISLPSTSEVDSLKNVLTKNQTSQNKIKTLALLGKAYYNKSDLDNALKTQSELLEVISKHGTKIDSAKCFRLIGLIYMQKSRYPKSLENLMRAQNLFGEAGDSSLQATSLMNVGIVYDCMNNLPMSLSYYDKAMKYFERKKDNTGIARCAINTAIVLTKQQKYERACENLIRAAKIYSTTGNDPDLAAAYINLGLTYKKMKKYDLAIEYHNKAFEIWKKADDQTHICYYYLNMGQILLVLNRLDEARSYLVRAETLAKNQDSKDLLARAYEFLSDYNVEKKNYSLAYLYLNKAKQISDSILNAESAEKVNQIQYQYEIVSREADNEHLVKQNLNKELQLSKKNMFLYILSGILIVIALLVGFLVNQNQIKRKVNRKLEEQNLLIRSQKNELIKLNASKDKFLSILAHDIKNPLGAIFGISKLLVTDYDSLTKNEKLVFTQDIHTLSINLTEIIETLLTWSISQSGMIAHHPKSFNITDLCQKSLFSLQIVAKQKDIMLVSPADNELMVLADENMILSVLQNLINNAIKYSYIGSEIRIVTKRVDGHAEISVIDSGVGLSPDSKEKLFRYDQHFLNKGTSGESGTGLGLILCKDFVEKNGGTIRVESELKKGSTFVFTLPTPIS